MINYDSFAFFLERLNSLKDGWAYVDRPLSELSLAKVVVIGSDEDQTLKTVQTPTGGVPEPIHALGMHSLLDVATLQDVVRLRYKALPQATLDQVIEAIRYYVVEDDFLE